MLIQPVTNYNQQPNFQAGLYFTKSSVFSKNCANISHVRKCAMASAEGYRYFPDTQIKPEIAERLKQIPIIKELAEKFDTFIFFTEDAKGINEKYTSFVRVTWADPGKKNLQRKGYIGLSEKSSEEATENLLDKMGKEVLSQ